MIVLLIAFIAIQFFHPPKNQAEGAQPGNIASVFPVPENVKSILEKACNDCHSNNTAYPWYSKIQPVDWWMDNHVKEGKRELNFDEYAAKPLRYQYHKMEEIIDQVKKGEMPLNSYTWIHKDAILNAEEKTALTSWANGIRTAMEAKYPMDSLVRKKVQ